MAARPRTPALSVVVPCRDAESWIEQCLRSILAQSFRDLEVIVVDDGSRDRSLEIVQRIVAKDPRVRVAAGAGRGPGAARNAGVRNARGRLLAFADADDLVLPGAYGAMVGTLQKTGSDFAAGGYVRIGAAGRHRPRIVAAGHDADRLRQTLASAPQLLWEPVLWNKVFVRDFWDRAVGSIPEDVNYEDQEPVLRAGLGAAAFDLLERDVYAWRLPEGRGSRSQSKAQVTDLRDRLVVIGRMADLLDGAEAGLRDRAFAHWLGNDLGMYARLVPVCDDAYFARLHQGVQAVVARAPGGCWPLMPFNDRALTWAVARGKLADVEEILGTWAEETTHVPLVRDEDSWCAAPAFVGRVSAPIPAELLWVQPVDVGVECGLRRIDWDGPDTLLLTGYAFLPGIDLRTEHPDVEVAFVAADGRRIPATVVPGADRAVDEEFGDPLRTYASAGFTARLSLAEAAGCALPARVEVRVTCAGVGATVALPVPAGPPRMVAGPVHDGARWCASADDHRHLRITRTQHVEATATSLECNGRALTVTVEPQRAGLLEDAFVECSSGTASARLTPDLNGPTQYAGELPPLPEALARGGERVWDLHLVTAQGAMLPLAWTGGSIGTGAVRARVEETGTLALEERAVRVTVTSVQNGPEATLRVLGRCSPPQPGMRMGLVSSRLTVEADSLTLAEDGSFEATVPLIAPTRWSGDLPLPSGGHFLRWTPEPEGALAEWVRGSAELADCPADLLTPHHRVRATVRDDASVAVVLSPPFIEGERSAFEQRLLASQPRGTTTLAIVFEEFDGKTTGASPRAIYDAFVDAGFGGPLYWSVVDHSVPLPDGALRLVRKSAAWHSLIGSARVVVLNSHLPHHVRHGDDQFIVQTWHGTPIKKLLGEMPRHKSVLTYRRLMARQVPRWDLLLAQSQEAAQLLGSGLGFRGSTVVMAPPHTLRLAADETERAKVRSRLGLGQTDRVVLYAPTWRESHRSGTHMGWADYLDPGGLAQATGATVLVRAHHVTHALPALGEGVIDVSDHPNVQDVMFAADVLVTDYSSIVYDFELSGRPAVHYVPDLEKYLEERGVCGTWPQSSRWPITQDAQELAAMVNDALARSPDHAAPTAWHNTGAAACRTLVHNLSGRAGLSAGSMKNHVSLEATP